MVHFALWCVSFFGYSNHFCVVGVPVVWMVTSKGMEVTIKFFLNFIKMWSLEITPVIIMSDRDHAQMNAIKAIYLASTLLLCWWHVLRTMRMHFRTEEFPKLWECVHEWVKTPDQTQFESWWEEMQADPAAPQSFIDYLRVNWMPVVSLCVMITLP
jgi:transposase-like protein